MNEKLKTDSEISENCIADNHSDNKKIIDTSSNNNAKLVKSSTFDFIPRYAQNYLYYCVNVLNRSEKTVSEYYLDLRTFFRYLAVKYHLTNKTFDDFDSIDASSVPVDIIADISLTELYEYMNFSREERMNDVRARNRKTSSLKTFYKYLHKNAIIDENPTEHLEAPKMPKSLPVYLTIDESVRLLENIDGANKERNFAIITLFLNCGLRLSELVGLNLSNIQGNSMRIRGKGNKERVVYLNQACIDALTAYLKVRIEPQNADKNAVFISKQGKRISNRMVQTVVEQFLEKSGLDTSVYSTHKLRHTAATLMYQNGVDIRALQQVLGHENLGTTEIYTHLSDKQVRDAIEANPLNREIHHHNQNNEADGKKATD